MGDVTRALSWGQVRERGIDLTEYATEPLPIGSWIAILDLKVWGKTPCLGCYFTSESGQKYRLTAFPIEKQGGRLYGAKDGGVDLSAHDVQCGERFRLVTGVNGKGKPTWLSAERIS